MSELRPGTPARRPDSARPRGDAEPEVAPPSPTEVEAFERHLASLPVHAGAEAADDPDLGVLLVRRPGGGMSANYAAMPRWSSNWRESLAAVEARLRALDAWPSVLVADRLDRPVGLADALPGAGWSRTTYETVLWVGRASVVPHLDPAMRIEAVQPTAVAEHEEAERRVFGLGDQRVAERRQEVAAALRSGRLRAYLVRVAGEPVAVARLSQGEGVAGIYAVGVAEGWRGKGYGTLITTVATRAGLATGNRLVWLSVEEGNAAARHVYAKLGFAPAFDWARWLRDIA